MKMRKRWLSLALVLLLCLTLLPATAYADEAPTEGVTQENDCDHDHEEAGESSGEIGEENGEETGEESAAELVPAVFNAYTVDSGVTEVDVPLQNTSFSAMMMLSSVNSNATSIDLGEMSAVNATTVFTATEYTNGSVILDQPLPGPTVWNATVERVGSDTMRIVALLSSNAGSAGVDGEYEMFLWDGNAGQNVSTKAWDPAYPNGWVVIDTVNPYDSNMWNQTGDNLFQYNRTITDSFFFVGNGNVTTNASYGIGFTQLVRVVMTDINYDPPRVSNETFESDPSNVLVFNVPEVGQSVTVAREEEAHTHNYQPKLVTAATCTTDAVIRMECSCGEVDPNGRTAPTDGDPAEWFAHHTWGPFESNSLYHWATCTVCNISSGNVSHSCSITSVLQEPTCIEGGSVNAVCDVCQRTMLLSAGINADVAMCSGLAAYKALGHDFSGPVTWFTGPKVCTSEEQGTHAATCTRCGIHDDNTSPHSWTGIHNVSNGNCADPNDPVIQEGTCSECEATLHIEKPREHMPVLDNSQDVEPTCTEAGKRNGHRCMICGTFYDFEFVEALGHDWKEDERKDATCEEDGYIHYTCTRCEEEKTEVIPCKTQDRHHHWTLNIVNAASCLGMGSYDGDICTVCGAKTNDFHGEGYIDELGHKVTSVTTKIGRVRNKVSASGTPMEITCYRIDYVCGRCKARLGTEYYTVAVATASVIGHGSFQIEPGKDVNITDMKNGIHVNGNMADDGGVYFNGSVMDGLSEVVEQGGKKYEYRKVPANSFIIEFSDWFLAEQADGEYTLEIINGDEYWPMVIVIENHKIVEIKKMEMPDAPDMTDEEYQAWLDEAAAAGVEVKELGLGCPDRENG